MVTVSRIVTCALAVAAASAAAACGSLIGIEDGTLDPELNGGTDSGITSTDGATSKDSGTPPSDAATARDTMSTVPRGPLASSPGGSTTSLPCTASASCAVPGETCCVIKGSGGDFTGQCAAMCAPPGSGERTVGMKCGGPINCGGGLKCCLDYQSVSETRTSCKSDCGGFPNVQLCTPSGSNPCPSNFDCRAFSDRLPSGYHYCQYTGS